MPLSTHQKRIATAAVLLPVLGLALWQRGPLELVVLSAISLAGLWEFYSLFWRASQTPLKLVGLAFGMALILAAQAGRPWLMLAVILVTFWLANLRFLRVYSRTIDERTQANSYAETSLVLVAGLLYVPMLLQFVLGLRVIEVALILLAVMASDTGAYYAGSIIGGPKIWPQVSPKKTWAGSVGGMVVCAGLCLAMGAVDEYWLAGAGQGRPWWMWLVLGVVLNAASQFGDFFESALKRRLEVKDSGKLLPGHGGVLDRIDSLLLAVPAYAGLDAIFDFFR